MSPSATDMKRRALGKGLDSLLPRVTAASAPAEIEGGKPMEIPIEQIDRNPFQTRSHMNDEQLAELAASITANGVVQPVLVRPLANGRFQLIAGERAGGFGAGRQRNGSAILRRVSDEQAMEITIVENLQRTTESDGAARLLSGLRRISHDQEQMATRTGKERATVVTSCVC